MVKVVGVRFKRAGKVYYFDPDEFELAKGDQVIVETARGIEFGETVGPAKEVTEEELTTPLKKVIRIATEADAAQLKENEAREKEAFSVAARKISEHNLEMDLVDVEFTFDGNKIIFYFTAEGRVDFRELVRDLAAVFRTRIELRQIGVRDEAKMLGGIGPCGRALCCTTFLGDFAPVSIKMAKEQNLSLNPTKISGLCGRLLCCLRYESEHYERAKAAYPTVGTPVSTKDGDGRVSAINVIKGMITVEFPTGVQHDYPADAVRSHGKSAAPQRAEAAPEETAEASAPVTADVDAEAAPATADAPTTEALAADHPAADPASSPCSSCAGHAGGTCPRAEAEQEALKEDAVLVAEVDAGEARPPIVTVFEQPRPEQQRPEPAEQRQRPEGPRQRNSHPAQAGERPQGGSQHRNRHRSHNNRSRGETGQAEPNQTEAGGERRDGGERRGGGNRDRNGGRDNQRNNHGRPPRPAGGPQQRPRQGESNGQPGSDPQGTE